MEKFHKVQNFQPNENTGVLEGEFLDYLVQKHNLIFSTLQSNPYAEQGESNFTMAKINEFWDEQMTILTKQIVSKNEIIGVMIMTKKSDKSRDFEVKEV